MPRGTAFSKAFLTPPFCQTFPFLASLALMSAAAVAQPFWTPTPRFTRPFPPSTSTLRTAVRRFWQVEAGVEVRATLTKHSRMAMCEREEKPYHSE